MTLHQQRRVDRQPDLPLELFGQGIEPALERGHLRLTAAQLYQLHILLEACADPLGDPRADQPQHLLIQLHHAATECQLLTYRENFGESEPDIGGEHPLAVGHLVAASFKLVSGKRDPSRPSSDLQRQRQPDRDTLHSRIVEPGQPGTLKHRVRFQPGLAKPTGGGGNLKPIRREPLVLIDPVPDRLLDPKSDRPSRWPCLLPCCLAGCLAWYQVDDHWQCQQQQ